MDSCRRFDDWRENQTDAPQAARNLSPFASCKCVMGLCLSKPLQHQVVPLQEELKWHLMVGSVCFSSRQERD